MNLRSVEKQQKSLPKIIGMFLIAFPSLFFRFFIGFLQFKQRANKAAKQFTYELRKQGIDKRKAKELTILYLSTSRFQSYISFFRNSSNIG